MLKIYFDGYEVGGDWVRSLSQKGTLFNNKFKLGSTLCRTFSLKVDKRIETYIEKILVTNKAEKLATNSFESLLARFKIGVQNYKPQIVTIVDENGLYATLYVDSIDTKNNRSIEYSLVDKMIFLNKEFEYDTEVGYTVGQLAQMICNEHGLGLNVDNLYLWNMPIKWSQTGMSQRDFISYIAEVNGGYAYIDSNENLTFARFTDEVTSSIAVEECSSFKVGTKHVIDRVYVELSSNTHYYPETSNNETLYLNPNNILLTDLEDGSVTIQSTVEHVQNLINGFTFYDINVERCPLANVNVGEMINFNLEDETYPTICEADYKYNGSWVGGYSLNLESSVQQETKVQSTEDRIRKNVLIVVDREIGSIKQEISDLDEKNSSKFEQLSERINMDFVSKNDEGYVNLASHIEFNAQGINISGTTRGETNATSLQLSSSGAYIQNADGTEVASMTSNTFRTGSWKMEQTNNGNTFNIFKEYN